MPKRTANELMGRRVIEANFEGGALSSDGELMLLRQVDQRIGLSAAVARDPDRITHSLRGLVAQPCTAWRAATKTSTIMTNCAAIR